MEVLWRVLVCCGHVPKRANNNMRGRLWCVSRNAAAGKSTARQCISIDADDLMFSLLLSKFFFTRLIVQIVVCSLIWNESCVHAVFT